MKVLVTGGSGFLGKHVVKKLYKRGYEVNILHHSMYNLKSEHETFQAVQKYRPDAIVHLAATVGGIGANMKRPGEFFYNNMLMGMNIIEAARIEKIKILVAGTVCSYPKFTPVPFKEEDLWNGYPEETNAPYGIAKKALLVMLQAYRQQYGLNGIFLIPVNLYGPGDNFDPGSSHVIPALIKKFVDAKENNDKFVEVWGTGKASREFLYVEDAARGIVKALEKYNKPEPVNLGNGKEYTIKKLVKIIKDLTGYKGKIKWNTSKPDGQPRRVLNIEKAKSFGFLAKTSFEEGLKKTYKYYLKETK